MPISARIEHFKDVDGEQGNDLKVVLNRTDKGTDLNVLGNGKATNIN